MAAEQTEIDSVPSSAIADGASKIRAFILVSLFLLSGAALGQRKHQSPGGVDDDSHALPGSIADAATVRPESDAALEVRRFAKAVLAAVRRAA